MIYHHVMVIKKKKKKPLETTFLYFIKTSEISGQRSRPPAYLTEFYNKKSFEIYSKDCFGMPGVASGHITIPFIKFAMPSGV